MLLRVFLLMGLALGLAACGGNESSAPAAPDASSATEEAGGMLDGAMDSVSEMGDAAMDAAGDLGDAAAEAASDLGDSAQDAVDGAVEAAGEMADEAGDAASGAMDSLTDEAEDAAEEAEATTNNTIGSIEKTNNKKIKVVVDDVLVRSKPAQNGTALAVIKDKINLKVIETSSHKDIIEIRGKKESKPWYKIKDPETQKIGWIYGGCVKEI